MADIDHPTTATPTDLEGGTLAPTAPADARQALKDGAGKLGAQATDRLRAFADTGKERAGSALDQVSTMLNDAASQVDDTIGAQFGDYARQAAGIATNLSESIKTKNVDELLDDARGFVRQSPTAAIGIAAAIGFVVARLAQSGIDADGATRG